MSSNTSPSDSPALKAANEAAAYSVDSSSTDSLPERALFDPILLPDDSYDIDGTYWADLPLAKRVKFVLNYDLFVEGKKELGEIWQGTKKNPLYPLITYFKNAVLPGAGLGLEGYVLFSIGNIKPLFKAVWKECWDTHQVCDARWVNSIEYLEVAGIMVGQILVGIQGDWVGRKFGLVQDAVVMFLGLVLLTASWGTSLNGWVICYAWCLFIYGIGVGGEYPMTATMSMESRTGTGVVSTKEDRLHRGRSVTSAFLMQGWGQFWNVVVLMVVLYIANGTGHPPYSEKAVQIAFRVSFAIPAIGTAALVWHRMFLKNTNQELDAQKKKSKVTGYDLESLKLTFTHFGGRMLATAGTWFANDVFFYGNKLFQSEFIKVITPNDHSVMTGWKWNLVNVSVSMVGYYMASLLIDNKLYGRKRMQIVGFMFDFILFIIPAFAFKYFTSREHIYGFQAMYFLSSFFNQFGPNSVTFLVAAEVYPASVRASAHGFGAAIGKLGAVAAAILYSYIDTQTKFYVVPWFGLGGAIMTWLWLPDTTGLDLAEQERRWRYIRQGRGDEYCGVAVHSNHLSVWERWMGIGKQYNPAKDYKMRIAEMRAEWEEGRSRVREGHADEGCPIVWNEHIEAYFLRTAGSPADHDVIEHTTAEITHVNEKSQ
ncbi:hypothetical protein TWF225_002741 [Orbilia oligospora]|uniref:Uncharacterized protein n=1 Tax=Orbilia oligospora TaxID=2813651 RepID=A0A7C8KUP6_ORBOL|nr:hypothetical protein TWF751_003918 [Orbilia oligospora]KAF3189600.1 hypothetical protein TWF225_002741 [Orbilia oligospora]KAF3241371.1 hypothetical protein TWF217_012036 [Orbilia oligospora]KAF3253723.1 hypothetical protein TWF128_006346 [Orbilia oligospora]KAF3297857.1 hypothetical protein TWF132_004006 [Orbilia oligospora]